MDSLRAIYLPDHDDDDDRTVLLPADMSVESALAIAERVVDGFREEWNDDGDADELESRLAEEGLVTLTYVGAVSWRGKRLVKSYK